MSAATESVAAVRWGEKRRPWSADRGLRVAVWCVVALSALQIVLFSFGRDQGIYAVVGGGLLEGKVPYRDLWDFKPPGIFFVYGVAEALFGRAVSSPRILEVMGLLAVVSTFGAIGREWFGVRTAGLVGGGLAALTHAELDFWHTGQPETYGGMLTVFALLICARTRGRGAEMSAAQRWAAWIAVGVLFGMAFLLKPPLGGGAVVCGAYLARAELDRTDRRLRAFVPLLVVGAASIVPIALTALWFWWQGAWPAVAWTFFEFVPGYTAIGWMPSPLSGFYYGFVEAFTGFSALLPAGTLAAFVLAPMHGREREGAFLVLGIICLHVAGIAMQGKFFQYHYAATLPLVALLAGLGLYKVWRRALAFRAPGVVVWAAVVVALISMRTAVRSNPGTYWERSALRIRYLFDRDRDALDARLYHVADYDFFTNLRLARALERLTPEGSAIFVWGFEPDVYFSSDRDPASRFIYDVPQRAAWGAEASRAVLMQDLAERPPKAIVVEHEDVFHHVTGNHLDSAQALSDFSELRELIGREYRYEMSFDKFDVYLIRGKS